MKNSLTAILLSTIGVVLAANSDVSRAFKSAKIVPEILHRAPTSIIEVEYGKKSAELGNEFTPTETTKMPKIHYKYECGSLYTLIMLDPDVPGLDPNRELVHWLVVNIPGSRISKGEVLAEYVKPTPPEGSGFHRYTFLIYKQNQGAITFHEKHLNTEDITPRRNFSVDKFTRKYDLGYPDFGNFFIEEAQSSCQ